VNGPARQNRSFYSKLQVEVAVMDKRFLDFIELAPRSTKPRRRGLTTFVEQGLPLPFVRDVLNEYGEYVDCIKFTNSYLNVPWRAVEARVKLYRDFQVEVSIDDPTFAIAYYQGKAGEFLRAVANTGFTHVQIDTRHIDLGDDKTREKADADELKYIAMARELGLRVEGEVGQKWEEGDLARSADGLLNVDAIVAEMKRLLAVGCEHVYLESLVIRRAIGDYGEKEDGGNQVRQIFELVGQDNLFFEIGQLPFKSLMCHRFWAVRNFGPDVNMGGSEPLLDVRYIEAIRRGFTYVPGPSKSTPRLWLKSLVRNGGKAAEKWWTEDYPIDQSLV
jgi:phosphosulfolactate synthase (CoM biosynthesis protein A)